jgi:photosystem II stability/assembly factor-like uncharacterized protein
MIGHPLAPISVSFISGSTGWLLGTPRCAHGATHACRVLLLRKTTNGGQTWSALPSLPAPGAPQGQTFTGNVAVSSILFVNAHLGWAYGPGLWTTHDGGRSWRQVSIHGLQVQGLAFSDGRVVVTAGKCNSGTRLCHFSVYSAHPGSSAWKLIARPSQVTWQPPAEVVAVGGTGYVFTTRTDLGPPVLLAGPIDGSAAWRPVPNPCHSAWSVAVAAVPAGRLFLGCGSEPGAGNQMKSAYLSADGGRTWRMLARPPFGGYLGKATMTAGGTIFLSGGRMDIYISRDRGRSWITSPSLKNAAGTANAGFALTAIATTNTTGIAYQGGVYRDQVWLTHDGGRSWSAVTVR